MRAGLLLITTLMGSACAGTASLSVKATGSGLGGVRSAEGALVATVDAWARFAAATGGIALTSRGPRDVPGLFRQIVREGLPPGAPVDLVFVVDTTGSMGDDIDAVKADMHAILSELGARNPDRQVGVVAYRDRGDEYLTLTVLALSPDEGRIRSAIESLRVAGGGDLREHVYAGLDAALREQPWRPVASRHIVLMGDAPPHDDYHDDPRNYDSVIATASARAVHIHTIGVHCDLVCRGLIAAGL